MKDNKTFVVVAKDFHFKEVVKIDATSVTDAIFKAAKHMKADTILFVKTIEECEEFKTDTYSYGLFHSYIAQLENGQVEIGHAGFPNYEKQPPYDNPDICWAIARLLKCESDYYPICNHIIIGEKLPRTIVRSSWCCYCGQESTECYF
jgi:hypothetical protein